MKFGPVTKIDKRNIKTLKKIDDKVMSVNCDVIINFQIYGQLGTIRNPSLNITFSLIVTFYLTKTENRTQKSLTQLSHYCFE